MTDFFKGIPQIQYEGPDSANEFAFKHYNPEEEVLGKPMKDQLRFAAAWWHSFAWPGGDPFGGQTFDRPWFGDGHGQGQAEGRRRLRDVRHPADAVLLLARRRYPPRGPRLVRDPWTTSTAIVDYIGAKMEDLEDPLLWGTANLFTHRRFMSGAATNPDPDVFAWSAATVKACMDATHKLGGAELCALGRARGL